MANMLQSVKGYVCGITHNMYNNYIVLVYLLSSCDLLN